MKCIYASCICNLRLVDYRKMVKQNLNFSEKKCGVVWQESSMVYKVLCIVCRKDVPLAQFPQHHKQHEQKMGMTAESTKTSMQRSRKGNLKIATDSAQSTINRCRVPYYESSSTDIENSMVMIKQPPNDDSNNTEEQKGGSDEPLIDMAYLAVEGTESEVGLHRNKAVDGRRLLSPSEIVDFSGTEDTDDSDDYDWDIESADSDYPDTDIPTKMKARLEEAKTSNFDWSAIATASPFTCAVCGRNFNGKRGLHNHLRTHQAFPRATKAEKTAAVVKPMFKCSKCDNVFRLERSLRAHMYEHTGFQCDICNKKFSAGGGFFRHKMMHAGVGAYKCPHCPKQFYTLAEMCTHTAKHTGIRKCLCELCGKPCRNNTALAQHMLRHSGERPEKCPQCDKRFYSKDDVKKHIIIHSEERPFVCVICGATFQRKKALSVHERIHSTEPLKEECRVCGKKFAKPNGLLAHMRVHDPIYGLSYPVGGLIGDIANAKE